MLDVVIREATDADVTGVAGLVRALADERGSAPDEAALREAIASCVGEPTHQIFVAAAGAQVVAYIAVHWIPFPLLGGCEGYISDLVVGATWRGHGLGNRLMDAVQEGAEALNCKRLVLQNRISDESYERGFYAKAGFSVRDDFATFVKPLLSA
jgi:ribosomal protein S18 acetylase RimI-like enzyme